MMEEEEHHTEDEHPMTHTTSVSGRVSKPPAWLIENIGKAALTAAE